MINLKSTLQYIQSKANNLSQSLAYSVFLMYYAWKNPDTPSWAKQIIMGAIAYLLAPIDGIPDLTPFIGFTDDLSILSLSLMAIKFYVHDEVKSKAKEAMRRHFKTVDVKSIEDIEGKL
tara:strand:- start:285 stop:641 length:357 start_codon:yes stop_codon:yes gene_type:complete